MDSPGLTAIGLFLILEGLLPMLAPGAWRETMQKIASMADGQIRFIGLGAVGLGCLILLI
jgi:uncharacterized protein